MSDKQAERILISGMSGSGKTTYAQELIDGYLGKYNQLIIVSTKPDLNNYCEKKFVISDETEPTDLKPVLDKYSKLFFRIDATDPRVFLETLGHEIMQREDILLVIDEAHMLLPMGKTPRALLSVLTGGRYRGHNVVIITPVLKNASMGIDLLVFNQATILCFLQMNGSSDIDRASDLAPQLSEYLPNLKPSRDGLPPEIGFRNVVTGEAGLLLRMPDNPKKRYWQGVS